VRQIINTQYLVLTEKFKLRIYAWNLALFAHQCMQQLSIRWSRFAHAVPPSNRLYVIDAKTNHAQGEKSNITAELTKMESVFDAELDPTTAYLHF